MPCDMRMVINGTGETWNAFFANVQPAHHRSTLVGDNQEALGPRRRPSAYSGSTEDGLVLTSPRTGVKRSITFPSRL